MAKLLVNLRHVPEDEVEEIRQVLAEGEFETYDTNAGRWGIGVAAIWLVDERQYAQAKAALDAYQKERALRAREDYLALRASGRAPTFKQKLAENPLQFFGYCIATCLILALMVWPLATLFDWQF